MGQKKRMKGFKALIAQTSKNLKPCIEEYKEGSRITGTELLKQGHLTVSGKPINGELTYRQVVTKTRYFSHRKKLKEYVEIHGEAGIPMYLFWLKTHHAKMKAKYPNFDPDPIELQTDNPKNINSVADPRFEFLEEVETIKEDYSSPLQDLTLEKADNETV